MNLIKLLITFMIIGFAQASYSETKQINIVTGGKTYEFCRVGEVFVNHEENMSLDKRKISSILGWKRANRMLKWSAFTVASGVWLGMTGLVSYSKVIEPMNGLESGPLAGSFLMGSALLQNAAAFVLTRDYEPDTLDKVFSRVPPKIVTTMLSAKQFKSFFNSRRFGKMAIKHS